MYIVIWQTSQKLYFKIVKGTYKKYYVGYENQYSHKIIFIIDINKEINYPYIKKRFSIKDIIIKYLKTCLKKLERR
jgi:hypothetical protein